MYNMGFEGQFGGGFIQGNNPPINGPIQGGVTYAVSTSRPRPKDRSGRKIYEDWMLRFPVSTGDDHGMETTFPVGPIQYHPTSMLRSRRHQ